MNKVINKTKNGSVVRISEPADYRVEFYSMAFLLSTPEYRSLINAVGELDYDYWMNFSLDDDSSRVIQVPLSSRVISLDISMNQLAELKQLLVPQVKLFRNFHLHMLNGISIKAFYN